MSQCGHESRHDAHMALCENSAAARHAKATDADDRSTVYAIFLSTTPRLHVDCIMKDTSGGDKRAQEEEREYEPGEEIDSQRARKLIGVWVCGEDARRRCISSINQNQSTKNRVVHG